MPRDTTSTRAVYGRHEDRYLELVRRFPLRPLRTDADLDAAVAVLDELTDLDELAAPEQDYLDVLTDLVEAYEDATVPMMPVGDADLLRALIEAKGATQAQVASGAGLAVSTVSELLSGKRKLNRGQIGKLAHYFKVSPGVFAFPG
ncbi:MAG: helix-turn-helix domain-containing protein [Gemmataceae bacterium]